MKKGQRKVNSRAPENPHKYWGMSLISDIIEHIDFSNLGGQIADFWSPPRGGATEGVVRWRTPLPLQLVART